MKSASVAELKAGLDSYIKECHGQPIVITQEGRPVAALMAVVDDDDLERLRLAHSPMFNAIMDQAYERYRKGETIPHDQLWAEVETWPDAAKLKPKQSRRGIANKPRKPART